MPSGGDGEVPRAYIVADQSKLGEEEVKDWVKERVAAYKQLRGGVGYMAELPKNAIGKILRRELRDKARGEMRRSKL